MMDILPPMQPLLALSEQPAHYEKAASEQIAGGTNENSGGSAMLYWLAQGETYLTLRTFWIDERFPSESKTATAIGGFIGYETAPVEGVSLHSEFFVSQRLWGINPDNDSNVNSTPYDDTKGFIYVGVAELVYRANDLTLRAGRMRLETPYADIDDIRMAPDTFEGAALSYMLTESLEFQSLLVTRWAGFDSTDERGNQSGFKQLSEDGWGMAGVGVSYAISDDVFLDSWYYHADTLFDLLYAETTGAMEPGGVWSVEWGVQAAQMFESDSSGIEGTVLGATAQLGYDRLYALGSYNLALVGKNRFVTDGFGGGPYYTSLDESTIASVCELVPGHDVSVYRIGAGADLSWWRYTEDEGLHVEVVRGRYAAQNVPTVITESNLMLWLGAWERVQIETLFSEFEVHRSPDPEFTDFKRYWIRAAISF